MSDHLGSRIQYLFLKSVRDGRVRYIPAHRLEFGAWNTEQFVGADVKSQTAVAATVRSRGWIKHDTEFRGDSSQDWHDVKLTPAGKRVLEEAEAANRFGERKPPVQTISTSNGTIELRNEGDTFVLAVKEQGKRLKTLVMKTEDAWKLGENITYMLSKTPSR